MEEPDGDRAARAVAHVRARARGGPLPPDVRVTVHFHPDRPAGVGPVRPAAHDAGGDRGRRCVPVAVRDRDERRRADRPPGRGPVGLGEPALRRRLRRRAAAGASGVRLARPPAPAGRGFGAVRVRAPAVAGGRAAPHHLLLARLRVPPRRRGDRRPLRPPRSGWTRRGVPTRRPTRSTTTSRRTSTAPSSSPATSRRWCSTRRSAAPSHRGSPSSGTPGSRCTAATSPVPRSSRTAGRTSPPRVRRWRAVGGDAGPGGDRGGRVGGGAGRGSGRADPQAGLALPRALRVPGVRGPGNAVLGHPRGHRRGHPRGHSWNGAWVHPWVSAARRRGDVEGHPRLTPRGDTGGCPERASW